MLKEINAIIDHYAELAVKDPSQEAALFAESKKEIFAQMRYRRNLMRRMLRKLGFKPTGSSFVTEGGSRYERWLHPERKPVDLSNLYLQSEARGHQLPHGMEKVQFFPDLAKVTKYLREDLVDVLHTPKGDIVMNHD